MGICDNAFSAIPDGVLNRRHIFYIAENKPTPAGYATTGAYVGGNRKLHAGFRVKGFQEFAETNASAPTVQLQSIRAAIDVTAYRKWNFRAMGVSRAILRSGI